MPNWCFSQTYIKFKDDVKQEEIKEFNDKLIKQKVKDSSNDNFDDDRTSFLTHVINLKELVPLQENGEWDYDLAVEKWGARWEPDLDSIEYNEEDKTLSLTYVSAWSPVNKALTHIFKTNNNIIKSIANNYEESVNEFYGEYYIDEENFYDNEYDLPYLGIEEHHLRKLYDLIQKSKDYNLPYEFVDYLKSKDSYDELVEEVLKYGDGDDDFEYAWQEFVSDVYDHDLIQFLKEVHLDFSEFIDNL